MSCMSCEDTSGSKRLIRRLFLFKSRSKMLKIFAPFLCFCVYVPSSLPQVIDKIEKGIPNVPKLYELKFYTNVTNRFVQTLVVSKMKNLEGVPQEATFTVLIPKSAYITGFLMEVGGKTYKGQVKGNDESKAILPEASKGGTTVAKARDSIRFTVSVNVERRSRVTFKLTYEDFLERHDDKYEIVVNIHPGQTVRDLQAEVYVKESLPLKFVKVRSLRSGNDIAKKNIDSQALITTVNHFTSAIKFNPDFIQQKQFAKLLGSKEEHGFAGQFIVEYDIERDIEGGEVLTKDGYFVHFFAPVKLQPIPKEIVFILDTSGSMAGKRIAQLKQAMNKIIDGLNDEDVLSLIHFNYDAHIWNLNSVESHKISEGNFEGQDIPSPYPANTQHKAKAKQAVSNLRADGYTNIQVALKLALHVTQRYNRQKNTGIVHQPIVVLLTDGEPSWGETNQDKIISIITQLNSGPNRTAIFSLSFGDLGGYIEFLKKLSLKNQGFHTHIYESTDASLQLQDFFNQISSPTLTNVTFNYGTNVTNVTQTGFPFFFLGSELVVAGYSGQNVTPATITANSKNGNINLVPQVSRPVVPLERLWGFLTTKQILNARTAADNQVNYSKQALDMALKYSFVTSVTSLVVAKPNGTRVANVQDGSKS